MSKKRSAADAEEVEENTGGQEESSDVTERVCAHCKTTNTQLWRGGPDGPKTHAFIRRIPH